jgi:hypothetical protein
MPAATMAELAKMVELSKLSPLFLGGLPQSRSTAGGFGAKVEQQCSNSVTLEVPEGCDVGKQM